MRSIRKFSKKIRFRSNLQNRWFFKTLRFLTKKLQVLKNPKNGHFWLFWHFWRFWPFLQFLQFWQKWQKPKKPKKPKKSQKPEKPQKPRKTPKMRGFWPFLKTWGTPIFDPFFGVPQKLTQKPGNPKNREKPEKHEKWRFLRFLQKWRKPRKTPKMTVFENPPKKQKRGSFFLKSTVQKSIYLERYYAESPKKPRKMAFFSA